MPTTFFAFVTRGPDRLYRATFPDLPGLVPEPWPAGEIESGAALALAAHIRSRTTPLPPPTPLEDLRRLYEPDAGFWLAVPVLSARPPTP
jgi:hypothetical protein